MVLKAGEGNERSMCDVAGEARQEEVVIIHLSSVCLCGVSLSITHPGLGS